MLKRSFFLFLYSTANIVGCILAILGLIAFFAGIIKLYWNFIIPGLYLCGYLMAPKNAITDNHWSENADLSARDLQAMLDKLIKKVSKRISPLELEKLMTIKENILFLLPRLKEMDTGHYDLHLIKQTVVDYLPKMLMIYLELPPAFAKMHTLRNGKTSQQILIEQLDILDQQINQIVINVNSKDAQALMAQAEFLKSKFANEEWL